MRKRRALERHEAPAAVENDETIIALFSPPRNLRHWLALSTGVDKSLAVRRGPQ